MYVYEIIHYFAIKYSALINYFIGNKSGLFEINKLRDLSLQVNYIDRVTAACRRSLNFFR
jgi:hypothetical protein